jgi:hypothetical protein
MLLGRMATSFATIVVVSSAGGNDAVDRTCSNAELGMRDSLPQVIGAQGNESFADVQRRADGVGSWNLVQSRSHRTRLVVTDSDDVNSTGDAKHRHLATVGSAREEAERPLHAGYVTPSSRSRETYASAPQDINGGDVGLVDRFKRFARNLVTRMQLFGATPSPQTEHFSVSFMAGSVWRVLSRRVTNAGSILSITIVLTGLALLFIGGLAVFGGHSDSPRSGQWRSRARAAAPVSRDVKIPRPQPAPSPKLMPVELSRPGGKFDRSPGSSFHAASAPPTTMPPSSVDEIKVMEGDSNYHFCHDLVVPAFTECMLIVPIRSLQDGGFNVADTNGSVVLHVSVRGSSAAPLEQVHGSSQRRLMLSMSTGETLAQCCCSQNARAPLARPLRGEGPSTTEFQLLRAAGDYYGSLVRSAPPTMGGTRYLLTTVTGARFHYWGAFERHAVNITDDSGNLLATTEVCQVDFDTSGKYYRLRVAPLTDVGLILCSLLCIHHLDVGARPG